MVTGQVSLRFEDVAMDGRVRLEPLVTSLGLIWRAELVQHPMYPWMRDQGILPISTRFVIEAKEGPFAVENGVTAAGSWQVQRAVDAAGATRHFLLVLTSELDAPRGRTTLPPPEDAGVFARVGSVRAEHVFTRPFEEGARRRVHELGDYGKSAPLVPWAEPHALLELPEGAVASGALEADPTVHVFGLAHTDSNQHVNALNYPRLFEEACLRRLRRGDLLARYVDVRYRKPSFPSDRLSIVLQPYQRAGRQGAVGAFVEPGGDAKTGRVFLRMELE